MCSLPHNILNFCMRRNRTVSCLNSQTQKLITYLAHLHFSPHEKTGNDLTLLGWEVNYIWKLTGPSTLERVRSCITCDFSTSQTTNLWKHTARHTGDKPLLCSLCNISAHTYFKTSKEEDISAQVLCLAPWKSVVFFYCKIKGVACLNCIRWFISEWNQDAWQGTEHTAGCYLPRNILNCCMRCKTTVSCWTVNSWIW